MDIITEIKQLFEEKQKAFHDYKEANDERIAKLEKHEAVAEVEQKLTRINKELDERDERIEKQFAELKRFGTAQNGQEQEAEVKSAFNKLLRSGSSARMTETEVEALAKKQAEMSNGRVSASEFKSAMIAGSDPDGGYFVLPDLDKSIMKLAQEEIAMLDLAQVVTTSSSVYNKRVRISGSGYTWEGEETHPETTETPKYSVLAFPVHTIAANPSISQELLQDADVNVEAELMEAMNADFVEGIGDALINGNDNRRPRGLLSYPTVMEANWKWGSLAYTKTGAANGFATENAGDALINTLYSLKTPYLGNATWLMNRSTLAEIRKMKDGQGNYLWQPSFQIGQPDTLLGYGLRLDSKMPNLGAGATPIAFGDFRRGYLVVRRSGMTLIRDQYTQKPYVVFSTRMRLGGGVQNFEAIKLLKCAA